MPVEVKQMVIKSSVNHNAAAQPDPAHLQKILSSFKTEVLRQCEQRTKQLIAQARTR